MLALAATYGGHWGPPGGGPGPWMLMAPFWLLFWMLLTAGVFLLVLRSRRRWGRRGPWGPGGPQGPGPWGPWGHPAGPDGEPAGPPETPEAALARARGILHERYAKGEISTEEYRERIDNLI